jgi:signal transduction histidine kinase/ligand-binding sensor domain-containing protein/CheY-like chemotaxis protein
MLTYKKPKGYLCILILSLTLSGSSQSYDFREYTVGLAQPYVYSIIQDNNGYLWMGTGNGLSRYDGINFKSYTTNDSLADNFVTCCFKNENELWFGHMDGQLTCYDGKAFKHNVAIKQKTRITDIEKSPNGQIWASSYANGLVKVDKKTDDQQNFSVNNQPAIFSFKFITDNEILIGSINGVSYCRLNQSDEVEIIQHLSEIPESKVPDIIKMRNDSGFYVATENSGIFQLMPEGKRFKVRQIGTELNLDFGGIQSIYEDSKSNLWIGTFGNGLIKLVYSLSGQFNKVTYFNKSTGFSTNHVKTVYEDREGNIWSGNYGNGLTQITEKTFLVYTFDEAHYGNGIYSIFADNNYRWLGTDKGLLKINPSTGEILTFYSTDFGLPQDKITAIYSDQGKELWIGTDKNGVYRMLIEKEKIISYKIGYGTLENSITTITGRHDQVWIGTKKGVCSIHLTSNKIQWYTIRDGLPHNFVSHLFFDSKGIIWVSTLGNTLAFIEDGKVGEIVITSEKGILSLGTIAEDNDSNIWVGSSGSGIFRIESDTITNLTSKEGLLSEYSYSLIGDKNKNIWVVHRGGISKVRTIDFSVKSIQQYVGIKSDYEFNTNAIFKDNKDRILFGSNKGLLIYDPSLENPKLLPPVLNITSFKVNDEEVDYGNKLILPPGNYKIKIEFLGINLKEPALVNYQYQMEGYDQSPENTRTTSVTYPHLNYGKYTFVLWASSGDGVMTKSPLNIIIIIKTPVWKHWWFYVIVFLLLVTAVIIYIIRRDYKHHIEKRILELKVRERTFQLAQKNSLLEEKQKEITNQNNELEKYRNYLEQLVDERTKELLKAKNKAEESDRLKTAFLNNISHEIRTPLNAICGFSKLLEDDSLTKEDRSQFIKTINDNSDSLLLMIREILDISQIESTQIVFLNDKFNIDDVLNDLETHYKLKNNKKIEFEFINKAQNNGLELYYDDVRFRKIFIHLLNNASKFTESGQIKFGYEALEKSVRFFVSDTGIGIDKSEVDKIFNTFYKIDSIPGKLYRGTGLGLTICKKMVEQMGGEIWVESVVHKGSVFYFTLPITTGYSKPNNQERKKVFKKDFLKNITILVAEDNPVDFELVNKILKSYGAEIKWAHNGQEAINFIKNDPNIENCIILMDIKMPLINGYEANKQIKSINREIPVIAYTAYAQMADKQKIMNENFDDYISKPINTETLLTILSKFSEKNK